MKAEVTRQPRECKERTGRAGWWLIGAAFLLSGGSTALTAAGRQGRGTVVLWGASLVLALAAFCGEWRASLSRLRACPVSRMVLPFLVVLLPVAVRVANFAPNRIFGDGVLTASFSVTENLSASRFFSPVPEAAIDWVCQFPSPFFVLQRGFFSLFGDSLEMVRWSIQPWVFLTGLFLFLVARRFFDRKTALYAVAVWSFLGMSVYLDTIGLHFISSTAVFLVFFWFALRWATGEGLRADAVGTGVACGFCFLFYTSSYIALPFLFLFVLIRLWRDRGRHLAGSVLLPFGSMALALGPFVAVAAGPNSYFLDRIRQLSLVSAPWSEAAGREWRIGPALSAIGTNFLLSFESLYRPGIGGAGGYWFGHRALFDPPTLAFLLAGLCALLALARRKPFLLLVPLVVGVAFFSHVVLAYPPPGFHRFSIAFPFVSLLVALPIALASRLPFSRVTRGAVAAGSLALLIGSNVDAFSRAAATEYDHEEIRIASYLNQRFSDRKTYVAAFPGQAFGRLAYFASPRRPERIMTAYHKDLIRQFRPDEKYLYVVLFPEGFRARFERLDSNGRFVMFGNVWGLFFN